MNKYRLAVLAVLILATMQVVVAQAQEKEPTPTTDTPKLLQGKWQGALGGEIVTFLPAGVVDGQVRGGHFRSQCTFLNSRITFQSPDCAGGAKGVYSYGINGNVLYFRLRKDDCYDRMKRLVNQEWHRVP